jgi:hypothetical protein
VGFTPAFLMLYRKNNESFFEQDKAFYRSQDLDSNYRQSTLTVDEKKKVGKSLRISANDKHA